MQTKVKTLTVIESCKTLKSALVYLWIRGEDGESRLITCFGHSHSCGMTVAKLSVVIGEKTIQNVDRKRHVAMTTWETKFGTIKARVQNRRLFLTVPDGIEID